MKRFYFTLFVLTIFVKTYAVNQYVDPSFTGTSTGTLANPWKAWASINFAAINAGDTIFLKAGQRFTSGQINFSRSGSSGNPIVITSYGTGAKPLFWGNGSVLSYLFNFQGRSWVTLDGLRFSDTTISPTDRSIPSKIQRAVGTGTSITIRNCDFDRTGLAVYFVGGNNRMEGCDVGNMRMIVNTNDGPPPGNDNDYGANAVVISSAGNTITKCYFHDCWATSFDYGYDGGGVEFFGPDADNNTITYNTFYGNNGENECGSNGGGVQENNVIAYNKYINNGGFMLVQNGTAFTVNVANFQVYNNVIIQNAVSARGQSSSMMRFRNSTPPTGTGLIVFRNNIVLLSTGIPFTRSGQLTGSALTRSNNIYITSGGSVVNYTQNGTESLNPSGALWESTLGPAINWNFTPAAGSRAIDYGTPLGYTVDFTGKAIQGNPDAGIIERAAVVQSFRTFLKFVN